MFLDKIWSDEVGEYYPEAPGAPHLKLSKFNLLIGPNNSGKSRFLRAIFSSPLDKISLGLGSELRNLLENLGDSFEALSATPYVSNIRLHDLINAYNGECLKLPVLTSQIASCIKVINDLSNPNMSIQGGNLGAYHLIRQSVIPNPPIDALKKLQEYSNRLSDIRRYYIPILRGMRPLGGEDLFLNRTIKDYFPKIAKEKLNVVTGFDLYELLVSNLLGQPEQRVRIREYEKILGDEFFGGAEVTLIPEHRKDTVAVKIGNDDQFPIYNLGDGLQQVIIITSAAFLQREYSIFFIEEPEACLHPGLLRKLAQFLLNHTNHQYIATTHSNHLLDLAETNDDVLISRVSKVSSDNGISFKIRECTRDRQLLNDLGVLASSIYLANSTIWVEGITDRLYLSEFMKKYLSEIEDVNLYSKYSSYIENFHYAFVEYQGGTLGHWGFDDQDTAARLSASSVCSSAFLIADGDIANKGDRAEVLKAELSERFLILSCKEIENLLPTEVIRITAQQIFKRKKSKTIDGLDASKLDDILSENIDKSTHGIGYHLDRCLGLEGKGRDTRRVFADESGTINDKVMFCREAISVMRGVEWEIHPEIRKLCHSIFMHITLNN